jgi:hypothetical protein
VTKHRLHVIIEDHEFWQEWNETVSWGLRQHLIIALMRLVCRALKEATHPGLMMGALISGHYKLVIDNEEIEKSSRGAGRDSSHLEPENSAGSTRAPFGADSSG